MRCLLCSEVLEDLGPLPRWGPSASRRRRGTPGTAAASWAASPLGTGAPRRGRMLCLPSAGASPFVSPRQTALSPSRRSAAISWLDVPAAVRQEQNLPCRSEPGAEGLQPGGEAVSPRSGWRSCRASSSQLLLLWSLAVRVLTGRRWLLTVLGAPLPCLHFVRGRSVLSDSNLQ